MPITKEALIVGLTAGVKNYDTDSLQFTNYGTASKTHNTLLVQVFGSAVTNAQNLQTVTTGSEVGTSFSIPADTGDAAPNFKVKSYLQAPVVAPIAASGNVAKIAFALISSAFATANGGMVHKIDATTETAFTLGIGNNATSLPAFTSSSIDARGDIFMVITVDPAIAVTAGGYLTVKGYAAGVSGSDSFTYVTLQSGS